MSNALSSIPITAARRRRQRLLLSALQRRQALPPAQCARLERALDDALAEWSPSGHADGSLLAALVSMMRVALTAAGAQDASPTELGAALAKALMAQASDDIASEAMRAGHGEVFAALQPWLERELDPSTAATLGGQLARSPGDIGLALARLRRRYRQRVESGLALWSGDAGQRSLLRRQLHAALTQEETQP